jgi:hypothetical protein
MDERTIRAIAEMIRIAARQHGVELSDVELTVCRSGIEGLEEIDECD